MCHPAQALVAELLTRCSEVGDIYKADYNGFYCVDCEEYKVHGALTKPAPCTSQCWRQSDCRFADAVD